MDKIDKLLAYLNDLSDDVCKVCGNKFQRSPEEGSEYFTCNICKVTLRKGIVGIYPIEKFNHALSRSYREKLYAAFNLEYTTLDLHRIETLTTLWINFNEIRKYNTLISLGDPGCGCCSGDHNLNIKFDKAILAKVIKNARKKISELEDIVFSDENQICFNCNVRSVINSICILCGWGSNE